MIKAVIFDCFGVLTTDGWLAFRDKYFHDKPALLARATEANQKVDRGEISYNAFLQIAASMAEVAPSEVKSMIEGHVRNDALFDYIKGSLVGRYKIGMLSNAANDWLDSLFTPEQLAIFDETVLSYQVGTIKPDPKIYHIIAEKLGVRPEECLFADDRQPYCDGAVAVGMQAIHFTSTEQFITEFEKVEEAQ